MRLAWGKAREKRGEGNWKLWGGGLSYLKKHGLGGHLLGPGAGRRGPYPSFRGLNPKHKNPPNPPPPSGCQRVSEVQIESRSPCLFPLCALEKPETGVHKSKWPLLACASASCCPRRHLSSGSLSLYDDDDTLFAVARGGHNTNTKQAGSQEIQYVRSFLPSSLSLPSTLGNL